MSVLDSRLWRRAAAMLSEVQRAEVWFRTSRIGKLESALRTTGDTRAVEIADVIKDVAARFPNHLETLLENLDKANASKDVETANKIKESARSATDDWMAYLKKHELEIVGCEKNPWNLPVSIHDPINNSLQVILTTVLA